MTFGMSIGRSGLETSVKFDTVCPERTRNTSAEALRALFATLKQRTVGLPIREAMC